MWQGLHEAFRNAAQYALGVHWGDEEVIHIPARGEGEPQPQLRPPQPAISDDTLQRIGRAARKNGLHLSRVPPRDNWADMSSSRASSRASSPTILSYHTAAVAASPSSRYAGSANIRDLSRGSQASKDATPLASDEDLADGENQLRQMCHEVERAEKAAVAEPGQRWKPRRPTDGSAQGNVSFGYGNFGGFGKDTKDKRDHLARMVRRSPWMIIGLSEVQPDFEELLRMPARDAVPAVAEVDEGRHREYSFKTVRHNEEKQACLIGVRDDIGSEIQSLLDDDDGNGMWGHGKVKKAFKVSKTIIAKIKLAIGVAFLKAGSCVHVQPPQQ